MKRGKIEGSTMDSRRILRDDSEGGWARGKLSLWKVMSLAILSLEHSSEWQVIENAWQNTDITRKTDPRMAMNCQSYCYGIFPFCILSWDHISFFNETCLFFVSLSFWSQEMFSILFLTIFWSNSNMQLRLINLEKLKVFWFQKWLDAC